MVDESDAVGLRCTGCKNSKPLYCIEVYVRLKERVNQIACAHACAQAEYILLVQQFIPALLISGVLHAHSLVELDTTLPWQGLTTVEAGAILSCVMPLGLSFGISPKEKVDPDICEA